MLYLFTGNSSYLVGNQVKAWKEHFISKYGEFNMIHIKDINVDLNFLSENILSAGFLSEKKLVVLDLDSDINENISNFLINNLERIPEENIILFNFPNPDKRAKLYKTLVKSSEVKEFNIQNESDTASIIKQKYGNIIDNGAINELIRYKSNNLEKIFSEIEKLLINSENITKDNIINNIVPELEESIFQVIDDILNKNTINALKKIDIILNDTNIYAFYNNLLGNLRTSIFIMHLKYNRVGSSQITSILNLGNKAFLVNKSYKISYLELKKLYISLVDIDKKMKTGFLHGTEDIDFRYELERKLIEI